MKDDIIALLQKMSPGDDTEREKIRALAEICSQDNTQSEGVRETARIIARELQALRDCSREEQNRKLDELIKAVGNAQTEKRNASRLATNEKTGLSQAGEGGKSMLDADILEEFLDEAEEHFQHIEANLLNLENNPDNAELINAVFRAFHSAKSTAGFMGLTSVSELAHQAEMLIDRARRGEIQLIGENADLALECGDVLNSMIIRMRGYQGGELPPLPENFEKVRQKLVSAGSIKTGVRADEKNGPERAGASRVAEQPRNEEALRNPVNRKSDSSTIRVNTQRLDKLIDMVGELVTTNSMISQDEYIQSEENPRLSQNVMQLNKIACELQDLGVSLRMVPLGPTFQKMGRLVRDLSRKIGKPLNLVIEGEETEIDRNMVETLNDPLVHLIRNAIDHGLESPEERLAKGKPHEGRLVLRAFHLGGNIVIELRDDGRGLNSEKILAKAKTLGLVADEQGMDNKQVFNLIFEPGFSTSDTVTEISGRGVGLDVVRRNIESIRGRIDVQSQRDRGTTFTLRIPLTMAIVDSLLLKVSDSEYLVPTLNVKMAMRPEPTDVATVLEQGETLDFRGSQIPVLRLHELFQLAGAKEIATEALILVVEHENDICALMADELLGQQQVVVKALGNPFRGMEYVAGAAILGDGKSRLILDVAGIMRVARSQRYRQQVYQLQDEGRSLPFMT